MNKSTLNPKISIVMPSYNHGRFIGKSVLSVISQTYKNWNLIIIDNNSNDETDSVLSKFFDERIEIYKINNNGIIGSSRNLGIELSTGDWVAFIDSDDIWYESRLQTVVELITHKNDVDLISTDEIIVNNYSGKKRLIRYRRYNKNYYRNFLLKGNSLSPSATVVKKIFIDNNNIRFSENPDYVTAEDYDFWLNILNANAKLIYINKELGESIIHSQNNSLQSNKHRINSVNVVKNHVFNVQGFYKNKNELWRIINAGLILSEAKNYFFEKNYNKSLELLFKAINESKRGCLNYLILKFCSSLRRILLKIK